MSVLAIIQARAGGHRFPGKLLRHIEGVPVLAHTIRRVRRADLVNRTIVAVPEDDGTEAFLQLGRDEDTPVYVDSFGDEADVLGRFSRATRWADLQGLTGTNTTADVVVRITGEDVFKDWELIDYALTGFLAEWTAAASAAAGGLDVQHLTPPHYLHLGGLTWPWGLDVEVMTRFALDDANAQVPPLDTPLRVAPDGGGGAGRYLVDDPRDVYQAVADREHVTPWIARNHGCWQLKNRNGHGSISDHWSIDTPADLEWARGVYAQLYATNPLFGFADMIRAGCVGTHRTTSIAVASSDTTTTITEAVRS